MSTAVSDKYLGLNSEHVKSNMPTSYASVKVKSIVVYTDVELKGEYG